MVRFFTLFLAMYCDSERDLMTLKAVVTGGAGFMGSSLCAALAIKGWDVTIFDNLTVGSRENVNSILRDADESRIHLVVGDCTQLVGVQRATRDCDAIFHFAANPEARIELNDPRECFRQNVIATHNVLESFRESKANLIVFPSTSAVYGRAKILPTREDYAPLEPISVYGASKLADEAMVSAYCHSFDKQGIILRFVNVLGPRSTHGVVSDFVRRLRNNPNELSILGDGTQNKSYLYIDDCVKAIQSSVDSAKAPVEVFNVGSEDQIDVEGIARTIVDTIGLKNVRFRFVGGPGDGSGWVGDVKNMLLDISRLKLRGWKPMHNSQESIRLTVKCLLETKPI